MNMYKLSKKSTRALCEGGIMVALAVILGMLRLYRLPNGGSITIAILPLVFFAARYGPGWGFLAGFAYGGLDYIVGHGIAIDWTSILFDYFLSYGLLGLGAGLFPQKQIPRLYRDRGGRRTDVPVLLSGGRIHLGQVYAGGVPGAHHDLSLDLFLSL